MINIEKQCKNNKIDQFEYRGKKYGLGTVITFDDKNYYRFVEIVDGDYLFVNLKPYTGSICIYPPYLEKYELTIIRCDQHNNISQSEKIVGYIDYSVGWLWYIITMAISLIFKDWLYAWIIITITFIAWRKSKRGE